MADVRNGHSPLRKFLVKVRTLSSIVANFRGKITYGNRIIGLEKQERNGEENQAKVSLFKNDLQVSQSVWPIHHRQRAKERRDIGR
ncbi:unnamed protein product [Heterotrigona itama]|uniref:Uncharacterized protein n=1 Tax=Heterotrigona itama TaxID=395501 RepID=A0A6V7HCY4_9HYME|nr:unnamed protein product [Heterotrigona itama]